jgi:hypothetical protein
MLLGDAGSELRAFYSATNGFDLHLEGAWYDDGDVLSIERSLSFYPVVDDSICAFADRLIPLRADGCGNYDCYFATLDFEHPPIVFWDRESPDGWSVLLGSSLDRYFELLALRLATLHDRNGTLFPEYDPERVDQLHFPWPHDHVWTARHDPAGAALLNDPVFRAMQSPPFG